MRPTSSSQVLAIQRLAGNKATSRLMVQRNPPVDHFKDLATHATSADQGETSATWTNNVSGVAQSLTPISTGITAVNKDSMVGAGNLTGVGAFGVLASGVALGSDAYALHHHRQRYKKAKKQGNMGLAHAARRRAKISGANVATDAGAFVSNAGTLAAGGVGIAAAPAANAGLTTALTHGASVAGVAGSAVALPIQLLNLIRQSRRAELQRQRMARLKTLASVQNKLKPDAQLAAKKQELADATRAVTDKQALINTVEDGQRKLVKEYDEGEEGRAIRGLFDEDGGVATERSDHEEALAQLGLELDKLKNELPALTKVRDDLDQEVKGLTDVVHHLRAEAEESGRLGDKGGEAALPSLEEIREYTVHKNQRGFSRRAIGATAAGIGVAGAAFGLAGAIELLKGAQGLGTGLGIAAAAIGGLAAAVGIGVGIWKFASWAKKKYQQSKKVEEHTKKHGAAPKVVASIDSRRKQYASALYTYAVHGTESQKSDAFKIIHALDPKKGAKGVDWEDELRNKAKTHDPHEKDQVIDHFMQKMASGG